MDLAHPHFAEPAWLWLSLLGPAFVLGWHAWASRQRRRQLAGFASTRLAPGLTDSLSPRRRLLRRGLLALAAGVIGLALARPQWGQAVVASESLGEDILFLLDCSRSMQARDVKPDRLSRSQLAILDFVQRHGQGRVGLIAFAGQAFLLCPLTFDYDAFRETLMAVDAQTIPVAGTDLGRALEEGMLAMEKNARRKILVLVTDGEDLEGRGIEVAKHLADQGAVIFTVGVGDPTGSIIPLRIDPTAVIPLRDAQGQVVRSQLDETTLREIAQATGGEYHPLGLTGEGLTAVRQVMAQPRFARRFGQDHAIGVDRFHGFVALAVALLVIESLMSSRRRLPSTSRPGTILAVLLGSICLTQSVRAQSTNTEPSTPIPAPDPNQLAARDAYNLGTDHLRAARLREAETALFLAVARNEFELQPSALFNLGHARFQQGLEALKAAPQGSTSLAAGRNAYHRAGATIESADAALASPEIESLLRAYLHGRGSRRELKAARKAIGAALEQHEAVLLRWQRASGDFKSSDELQPDPEARHNAQTVDEHIARLVDLIQAMQGAMGKLSEQQQTLQQRMQALKGKMPADLQEQLGADGDDEDEPEDGEGPGPEPQPGTLEPRQQQAPSLPLTPEEAANLLKSLQLDGNRKLPMGGQEPAKPSPRRGADW